MTQVDESITYRIISTDEVSTIYSLEIESFPSDEADSYDVLAYRQREAPNLQLGCYMNDIMIGFICATRFNSETYIKEAMKIHVPNGKNVFIHSVVVKNQFRRKGIGLKLLQSFCEHVKAKQSDVRKILLISKTHLASFYQRAGFTLKGKSNLDLGKDTWYEFEFQL